MNTIQDYYAILGVAPTATEEDIRQAYRLAALRFHPDVNKAPGADLVSRYINEAYEILSDRYRRREYDQLWRSQRQQGATVPGLALEALGSRRTIRQLNESQMLYTLVRIQPLHSTGQLSGAPLNLCLVIDRSKSMKGARLQNVKAAAYQIVEGCKPEDIISVVTFSDRAEVIVPASRLTDTYRINSQISGIRADGATEILAGLRAGLGEINKHKDAKHINHLILITDGRTYGDEESCLMLADKARMDGIGISGMGIGEDWNDDFLDSLASRTGGSSTYIDSLETVSQFLKKRVRSLAAAYAERLGLIVVPATDVEFELAMRLSPDPIDLPIRQQPIALGTVDGLAGLSLMLQFRIRAALRLGEFVVGRLMLSGEILEGDRHLEQVVHDLVVEVVADEVQDDPPIEVLDALNKLRFYRLQARARSSLENGQIAEAVHHLENLATRLFEVGEERLGQAALYEAQRITYTRAFSDEGGKRLKYGTRALLSYSGGN